jgi:SH3-like domain-containing protein
MRDCLLVVGLVVPLILFYPWIAAYLPDNVQASISSMTGGLLSPGTAPPAPAHPAAAPAAPPVERPIATVTRSVNVRATPAVKGSVVVTLQKSASVVVLEEQGNWTHVEVPAKSAADKPVQGWVYSSYLDARKPDK